MGIFQKNDGGLMDVIRCDEQDYLIWKWHPQGTTGKTSQRANAIRWGSSLRVKDGSVAVFVYPQTDGSSQDYIEGPADMILDTKNLPVLADFLGVAYSGASPFQAEIYFINLANLISVKFGVPYFDIFDPQYDNYGVPVCVRGSIIFRIEDYKQFIKKHRLDSFGMDEFQIQIRDSVVAAVKSAVIAAPDENGISVIQIERELESINNIVYKKVKPVLSDVYGVEATRIDISAIEIDKSSEGYQKLKKMTQNGVQTFVHAAGTVIDSIGSQKLGAKAQRTAKKDRLSSPKDDETEEAKNKNKAPGIFEAAANGFKRLTKNAPPPIPAYYVVINSEKEGPYDSQVLKQMIDDNKINRDTLVWTNGMKDWKKAEEEIGELFQMADETRNDRSLED